MTDEMEVEAIVSALLREHGDQFIGLSIPNSDIEPFTRQIAETALEAVRALRPAGEPAGWLVQWPNAIWPNWIPNNRPMDASEIALMERQGATVTALYASPIIDAKVAGPVVKGLEWADGNTASIAVGYTVVAEAPGYQIEQSDTGRFYTRSSMAAEFFATIEFADTLDQAKAAAQADYEARILRALASIDAGGKL